jgi:hypothetical protein
LFLFDQAKRKANGWKQSLGSWHRKHGFESQVAQRARRKHKAHKDFFKA